MNKIGKNNNKIDKNENEIGNTGINRKKQELTKK